MQTRIEQTRIERVQSISLGCLGLFSGILLIACSSAFAASADVELVQHTGSPFSFNVTKSAPSSQGTLSFSPFKYGAHGTLLSTKLTVDVFSDVWSYGYTPTASAGSFGLYTQTIIDASAIGGPSDLLFGPDEEEYVSWSGSVPPAVTLSGSEQATTQSRTFIPGNSGSSISYRYGWSAVQDGATWDTLTESINGSANVEYRFSIPVALPRSTFNNTFGFDVDCAPGSMCFYDPDVATGFIYEATGTAFTGLMIPGEYGDAEFTLLPFNNVSQAFDLPGVIFHSGETIDLTQFDENGLTKLKISGIEPSAGVDPLNTTGFVTGFSFSSNTGSFSMAAADVLSVPEPEGWTLMLSGLALIGFMALRRSAMNPKPTQEKSS